MYFVIECNKLGLIRTIVHQSLNNAEELALFGYLCDNNHPDIKDFKAIYYLQRSRYIDIVSCNDFNIKKAESRGLFGQQHLTLGERITKLVNEVVPNVTLGFDFKKKQNYDRNKACVTQKIASVNLNLSKRY